MTQQLKWQLGTVLDIRRETPSVKSLILGLPDWKGHIAGQRVDVRLTAEDGYQAQRSYSIASPPEDKYLMLTVERIDVGEVSPYLTDVLQIGDQLEMRGPIGGYFIWDAHDPIDNRSPLFLVAGGSGIVPLMAMLRHRANAGTKVPATLLYSSRSFEDVIYRDELDLLDRDDSSLRLVHTLTRSQPENWMGYARRIDNTMLTETAFPPGENPATFACGPTALIEAVATQLQELGYAPERIKTERFGPTGI
jgi:ferredoxin-NADP reductase